MRTCVVLALAVNNFTPDALGSMRHRGNMNGRACDVWLAATLRGVVNGAFCRPGDVSQASFRGSLFIFRFYRQTLSSEQRDDTVSTPYSEGTQSKEAEISTGRWGLSFQRDLRKEIFRIQLRKNVSPSKFCEYVLILGMDPTHPSPRTHSGLGSCMLNEVRPITLAFV